MSNTIGEKELKTNWPIEEGLDISNKLKGRISNLVPEESSLVAEKDKVGL